MKEIKGYSNYYISTNGDVISKRLNRPISKWVDNVGYYQCVLFKDGKRNHHRIHRLMGQTFLMETKSDIVLEVNHIDGDKLNNNIGNLELVTTTENTLHGYNKGLYKTNKRNIGVKVYDKESGLIASIYKSIRSASEDLGLNRKTISAIMFNQKTNNYDYKFEPVIQEDFYYIEIFSCNGKYIDTVPSMMQASEITGVERHTISDILNLRAKNDTRYIFKKKYKSKQWSQETIKNTAI